MQVEKSRCGIASSGHGETRGIRPNGRKVLTLQEQEAVKAMTPEAELQRDGRQTVCRHVAERSDRRCQVRGPGEMYRGLIQEHCDLG